MKDRHHSFGRLRAIIMPWMLFAFFTVSCESFTRAADVRKPDVVFIGIDDLNDWITLLDPKAPIKTPNLERLAKRGLLFTKAYCASPACNPSRVALLTGKRPWSTGVYGNASDWKKALADVLTLPQAFGLEGWRVAGAGKLFHHHHGDAFHENDAFDVFLRLPHPPDSPMPPVKLNRLADYGSSNTDWGAWPLTGRDTPDQRSVDFCLSELQKEGKEPLFLACGLFRPHMPFFTPSERRPETESASNETRLPLILEDDLEDVPAGGQKMVQRIQWFWEGMEEAERQFPGTWKEAVREYQSAAEYADWQVGRLLDGIDASGRNPIIILWSDHGYQLGEKDCWEKFTLWEKSTHVPFIVVAPGITKPGGVCQRPVDLMSIYPTLMDLAGIERPAGLDGESLLPLLREPGGATWLKPAISTYGRGNHSVRSDRWRYIRYADGTEELYDHSKDSHEWNNLLAKVDSANEKNALHSVVEAHKKWLPEATAEVREIPALDRKLALRKRRLASRPNILLIISEDNGPELGCYGEPYVRTPHLDRLASEGLLFERAYVPQAGCSQSRAALYTGLYPHQNGQIGLATWKFGLYDGNSPNLVRWMKQAGYRTGIVGKLHMNPKSAFPFDFQAMPASNFSRQDLDAYAREAHQFMAASDTPFFLAVNYPDAHRPFLRQVDGLPKTPLTAEQVKPLRYHGLDFPDLRQQTADYYNSLERLDHLIGDLLAGLEKTGKGDRTLVVYLGDHGADLLRGKRTSYEGGVRIPLIMKWPHVMKTSSKRVEGLVSTLDLLPTFLEVAGLKTDVSLEGQSLIPWFYTDPDKWREYLFTEYHTHSAHNYYPQRTVRNDRFKLIENVLVGEPNPGVDFTESRFFGGINRILERAAPQVSEAYRLMRQPPRYELYDLASDPYEFRNLANEPAYKDSLEELSEVLQSWRERTDDPFLDREKVKALQAELEACFEGGQPQKSKLNLNYAEFFRR